MYLAIVGTLVHIFVGCHLVIRPIHALHNNEFKLLCSDEFCDVKNAKKKKQKTNKFFNFGNYLYHRINRITE